MENIIAIFKKEDTISMKLYNMCELRKYLIDNDITEFKIKIFENEYVISYDKESDWYFMNNDKDNPLFYEDLIKYVFKKVFDI